MTIIPRLRFLTLCRILLAAYMLLAGASVLAQSPVTLIDILVTDGRASGADLTSPARGAPVLRLIQGAAVELRIASDRDAVLHLHGYRIETRTAPGAPAVMVFTARAAGRFPVETHATNGRHVALFYIEVHPK